jgi:hypothetical protein
MSVADKIVLFCTKLFVIKWQESETIGVLASQGYCIVPVRNHVPPLPFFALIGMGFFFQRL